MDFQQIVLIVLGILYFIFRSSGSDAKSNKKKPKPMAEGSTPSLEDIIRELSGQAPAPKPVVFKEVPSENRAKIKHQTLDTSEHEAYRVTVNDNNRLKKKPKLSLIPDKIEISDEESYDFDLRQAVINDAILNRPYQ